jgi:hypothetical protein
MLDNPPASNLCPSAVPFKDEIDGSALSVLVASPRLSIMRFHHLQEHAPKVFCVIRRHTEGRKKQTRFASTFIMSWAVSPQLTDV